MYVLNLDPEPSDPSPLVTLRKIYAGLFPQFPLENIDQSRISPSIDNFWILSQNSSEEDFEISFWASIQNLVFFSYIEDGELHMAKTIFSFQCEKVLKISSKIFQNKLVLYVLLGQEEEVQLAICNFSTKEWGLNPISE